MTAGGNTNRLAQEKSPYLLQHARNPVDWYPWGDEAFARARAERKPVFLSVGYATCHWCHVMERESFEDSATAAILNRHFVAIKVDREERPDVDGLYMTALQAMGQHGGWPMSMFLMSDGRPFYGGTYFPPESRGGRAGFPELLTRISELWKTEQGRIEESAGNIMGFLRDLGTTQAGGEAPEQDILRLCFRQIAPTYDEVNGGFGRAPKFPRPVALRFLFRYFYRTGDNAALTMALHALRGMTSGGMFDHLGGGYHRYSVDASWRVPHFEKMLYDQSQIVDALLDAFLLSQDDHFAEAARQVLDYAIRDLSVDPGGFASAEDADSPEPGHPDANGEGAFYVWTHEELSAELGEDFPLFAYVYGVEEGGNVDVDPQGEFAGKNILYRAAGEADAARRLDATEGEVRERLRVCRERLFAARSRRARPLRDDKVIAGWNGLMIGALARASRILDEPRYLDAARAAAECILTRLVDGTMLYRRLREGSVAVHGMLDDYAFTIHGLLELASTTGEQRYLESARSLAAAMMKSFRDDASGGLFDGDGSDPTILVRMKTRYDGAEPTGNSVAAMDLITLSRTVGDDALLERASGILKEFAPLLSTQPLTIPLLASAYDAMHRPPTHCVIAGRPGEAAYEAMVHLAFAFYDPDRIIILLREGDALPAGSPWEAMRPTGGSATAYLCRDFACELPVTNPDEFGRRLRAAQPEHLSSLREHGHA